jgi:hypothetical protein
MSVEGRLRQACHEAAHALTARVLGLEITVVRLGVRPACNLWLGPGGDEQARAAAACMSGSMGEEVGGLVPNLAGARRDRRQVRRLSLGDRTEDEARQAAREIVRGARQHVYAIAAALLLCGRLSGRQVARLVATAPPRRSRLGMVAAAVTREVYDGNDWYFDPGLPGRGHSLRQVQRYGPWYAALRDASLALCPRGARRMALSLASAAARRYPDPPGRGG